MNNKFELFSLQDIIQERFFVIPDYQRGYSWEDKQLNDLIKDIENLFGKQHKHYTGTTVTTKIGENVFEIVDGQQRLTSLIIIISIIYHSDSFKFKRLYSQYLKRGEIGNESVVLKLSSETHEVFIKSIIENTNVSIVELKSQANLINAKQVFLKWIRKQSHHITEILEIVERKLGFIFFQPENSKEIGIMFEVINNRGKDLSELEKIKNYFIYYSSVHDLNELREIINREWVSLQKYLSLAFCNSNEDENKFLRYCYLIFFEPKKNNTTGGVYEFLKIKYDVNNRNALQAKSNFKEIKAFVEFLTLSAKNYAFFYNHNFFESNFTSSYKSDFSGILKYLRCQPTHASMMPLILAVMAKISDRERDFEMLNLIEKVNFRTYILPKVFDRADSQQANIFFWAFRFYNNPDWTGSERTLYNERKVEGDSYDLLRGELIQFAKYYCPVEVFSNSLLLSDSNDKINYYDWQGLRYFLGRYEEYLQRRKRKTWDISQIQLTKKDKNNLSNDSLTKEHIWASKSMKEDFSETHIQKRRLGNFVLLGSGDNSSLSNNDVLVKFNDLNNWHEEAKAGLELCQILDLPEILDEAKTFLKKKLKRVRITNNYYHDLSQKINDLRETKLLDFALRTWSLPNENLKLEKDEIVTTFNI